MLFYGNLSYNNILKIKAALTMPEKLQITEKYQTKIQCFECALTVNMPILKEKQKAQCPRCGYTLSAIHRNANQRIIAFSITALIFLIASLPFKFLSFSTNGLENHFDAITSFFVLTTARANRISHYFCHTYCGFTVINLFTYSNE